MKSRVLNLSGNKVSKVWREGECIFKQQPKYLCDNEWYALQALAWSGYVPAVYERRGHEIIKMEFVISEPVTDPDLFRDQCGRAVNVMREVGLRHGDLTEYSVLVRNNAPVIIDWAESRVWDDPRPDKRREGDYYWMNKTMEKLINDSKTSD